MKDKKNEKVFTSKNRVFGFSSPETYIVVFLSPQSAILHLQIRMKIRPCGVLNCYRPLNYLNYILEPADI